MRILITDMQPISPSVGGGRQRLAGVFGFPPPGVDAVYLGTYDWPGERKRDAVLAGGLRELIVPLSPAHYAENRHLLRQHDFNFIDLLFHRFGTLSGDFMNHLRTQIRLASVVVFSHPWVYPLARRDGILEGKRIIYDAHNHEGALRKSLVPQSEFGVAVAEEVATIEEQLCQQADLITCSSVDDIRSMAAAYRLPPARFALVPNGSFTPEARPTGLERLSSKRQAIFIGSEYGPNNDAAEYIVSTCARAQPGISFVIVGSVCDFVIRENIPFPDNVSLLGVLSEKDKSSVLYSSLFALNPMFSGSGTNVKMFDYIQHGLPVCTTEIGARGIDAGLLAACEIVPEAQFLEGLNRTVLSLPARRLVAAEAAEHIRNGFGWEHISQQFYQLALSLDRKQLDSPPFISVIVPAYERPYALRELVRALADQSFADFEAVIVDQSREPVAGLSLPAASLSYNHVKTRGAIAARNHGARLARGTYLAFIDDDCLPERDWLKNAAEVLASGDWVGIEGEVVGEMKSDRQMRWVSNSGDAGRFLTANLFVSRNTFWAAGGFDPVFDHPHFREDTDLGLRVAAYGHWRRGTNVRVFHPSSSRVIERESLAERGKFFVKDALLAQRRPEAYRRLFESERQWLNHRGYWEYLLRGFALSGVKVPEFVLSALYADYLVQLAADRTRNRAEPHPARNRPHAAAIERNRWPDRLAGTAAWVPPPQMTVGSPNGSDGQGADDDGPEGAAFGHERAIIPGVGSVGAVTLRRGLGDGPDIYREIIIDVTGLHIGEALWDALSWKLAIYQGAPQLELREPAAALLDSWPPATRDRWGPFLEYCPRATGAKRRVAEAALAQLPRKDLERLGAVVKSLPLLLQAAEDPDRSVHQGWLQAAEQLRDHWLAEPP